MSDPALGAGPVRRALLRTALTCVVAGAVAGVYIGLDNGDWLYGLLLGLTSGLVTFPVALGERFAQRAALGRRGVVGAVLGVWVLALVGTLAAYIQAVYTDSLLREGGEWARESLRWVLEELLDRPGSFTNLFAAAALPFAVVTAVRLARLLLGWQCLLTPVLSLGLAWLLLVLPDVVDPPTVTFALFMIGVGGVVMAPGFAATDAVERWRWGEAEGACDAGEG